MLTALAIGGVLLIALGGKNTGGRGGYSYGGAPFRPGINRDPRELLPGFARKLEGVMRRMRAEGFDPVLWEGIRTQERAAALERRGTGSARSIHIYGAAADIVDRNLLWDAPKPFWDALGRAAKAEGLVWGGDWTSRVDRPHVQAIPVNQQAAFRASTVAERERWVA